MSCDPYCPEIDNASDDESISIEIKDKVEEIKKEIEKEIDKIVKPDINFKDTDDYKNLVKDFEEKDLTDAEKINQFARFIYNNGGISFNNIIELKQLCILVGATEQLEGFKDFPRENVLKMLEMLVYHTNEHLNILFKC